MPGVIPLLFSLFAALLAAPAFAQQSGPQCPFPVPVGADCPGDTYPIGVGFCTLRCAPGEEQNPWNEHDCWTPVRCVGGTVSAANACVCDPGERLAGGTCETIPVVGATECPSGKTRNAQGFCECPAADDGAECREARRREYAASPMWDQINLDYARELGLYGRGVTIAIGEYEGWAHWEHCARSGRNELGVSLSDVDVGEAPEPVAGDERWNYESCNAYYHENDMTYSVHGFRTHPDLPTMIVDYDAPHSTPEDWKENPRSFRAYEDSLSHALMVAGILAARENGFGVVGAAPEAFYYFGDSLRADHREWDSGLAANVEIINNSWGTDFGDGDKIIMTASGGEILIEESRVSLLANSYFNPEINFLLSLAKEGPPAERKIFVWAAGNDGVAYPDGEPLLGLFFPELRDYHLAVVALEGGRLAEYSNRCGEAAAFCLAAPIDGHALSHRHAIYEGPNAMESPRGYQVAIGTSAAAPAVSGALALVKEYFNRMGGIGNHELTRRLLRTADKTGIYADASLYGSGKLDLRNALSPQGSLRLRMGDSVWDGGGVLLLESGLFSGSALGDSAGRALRGLTLAAFDDLNAPFPISSEMVLRGTGRARLDGLGSHLRRWQVGDLGSGAFSFSDFRDGSAWWSLNAPGDSHFDWDERVGSGEGNASAVFSDWVGNPYSDLAGRGLVAGSSFRLSGGSGFRAAVFGESLGNEKRFRGVLAEFSFSPFADGSGEGEGSRWFAQAGGVRESDGLLASSGSGLFSDLNSRTAFAGLGFAGGLPDGWRYRLGAHWGRTSAEGGAWLTATDSLRSGSYAAGLERSDVFRSGDGLGFRIRQPLRVSGGLRFRVPTGRTKYGELTWSEVSGTPSGRELEWEARYRRGDESGRWGISAVLVSESGHRARAKTEGRALFAFERNF